MTRFDYYHSFILLGLLTCEELGASVITPVRCIYTAPIQRHSCTPSRCYFQVLLASTSSIRYFASIRFTLLILTYRQRHRLSSQSQSQYRHAAHRDRDRHVVTRSCIGMAGRINAPTSLYGNERACLTLMMMTTSGAKALWHRQDMPLWTDSSSSSSFLQALRVLVPSRTTIALPVGRRTKVCDVNTLVR